MRLFTENYQRRFSFRYGLIAIVYFALSVIGILHHELWLDEAHHFLLARDSNSISELLFNARYEGHPLLWNFLLYALTRFIHNPFYMQLLHITISLVAVVVFLRNAPFTDLFKVLFVFGYFMFFEYNIISRNYSVSILFLFLSCSAICSDKKNYFMIFLWLILLCCTHLFSLFCAAPLFIITVLMYLKDDGIKISQIEFIIGCVVFVSAVLFILWSIVPPPDHFLHQYDIDPYLSFKRIGKGLSVFFKGLYHIPDFMKYNFWNTNLFVDGSKNLSVILSSIFFIIPFILFNHKPISLFVFYSSTIAIIAFIFFSPIIAAVRHFGYITLLLVTSLWLSEYSVEKNIFLPDKIYLKLRKFNSRFKVPFVYSVLFIQLFSSVIVYSRDFSKPFSESKEVAQYLSANDLTNEVIAVSHQSSGPAISAYLDKKLFYPETNDFGSFCKWNTYPFVIDKTELISRLAKSNFSKMILVLNDSTLTTSDNPDLPVYADDRLEILYLTEFEKGIVRSENYRLYEAKKRLR